MPEFLYGIEASDGLLHKFADNLGVFLSCASVGVALDGKEDQMKYSTPNKNKECGQPVAKRRVVCIPGLNEAAAALDSAL